MDHDKELVVSATLEWCNMIRGLKGETPLDKLPKGARFQGLSCPCGEATGVFVGERSYHDPGSEWPKIYGNLPWHVEEFVRLFDGAQLPEYDREVSDVA